LWRALAISLAAHALLLWQGAVQRPPERAAGIINATLRPVEAAAPPAVIAVAPIRRPPKPGAEVFAAQPAATPARPAESALGVPMLAAVSPSPGTDSTPGGAERSPSVAAAPSPGSSGVAGGGGAGVDADGLRQYRLALAREARLYKRYPERALLAGIGGTAEVRVEHAAGAVPVARLARSSGHEALDAAALDMMRQAAPRTALPEPLHGRAFAVSLPVIFDASGE
jgi:protein TonB